MEGVSIIDKGSGIMMFAVNIYWDPYKTQSPGSKSRERVCLRDGQCQKRATVLILTKTLNTRLGPGGQTNILQELTENIDNFPRP